MFTSRRNFLTVAAAATATTAFQTHRGVSAQSPQAPSPPPPDHPIAVFAKPFQEESAEAMGERLQQIGANGIEATLRTGGQIEPANLGEQLPRLCEALSKYDQRVLIAASNVNSVDATSERQLELLAAHRIPYFRMEYYRYDFAQPILPQLTRHAKAASELAVLCKSLGITGLYQNHAGKNMVGAALWDLQDVLLDLDPSAIAIAIDTRHTTVELSQSWPAAYARVRPNLGAIYVKDFAWESNKPVNVPLGDGLAQPLFQKIAQDGLVGPLSLHMEYIDHRPSHLLEQRWEAIANDMLTLKKWLGQRAG